MKSFSIVPLSFAIGLMLSGCNQFWSYFGAANLSDSNIVTTEEGLPAEETPIVSHGGPVTDYVSLVDNLRAAGAEVIPGEALSQPFFDVTGQIIRVNGEDVQVFEFADETAAENAASQISPDGSSTGTTMITWVAPPHFYRAGKLIGLYVGEKEDMISLLVSVLGPQFAGQ